jgi:hypothetical protein
VLTLSIEQRRRLVGRFYRLQVGPRKLGQRRAWRFVQ